MSTWNPADKSSGTTLSSTNHVASSTSGNNGARGTTSQATGKWYFELPVVNTGGSGAGAYGIADSVYDIGSTTPGGATASLDVGGNPSGNANPGFTSVNGHALSFAIDFTNLKWWVRYDGGNWNNSGTANPATNTGGFTMSAFTAFIMCRMQNTGSVTMNAGDSAFTYTAPSGFSPWDGAVTLPVTSEPIIIITQ